MGAVWPRQGEKQIRDNFGWPHWQKGHALSSPPLCPIFSHNVPTQNDPTRLRPFPIAHARPKSTTARQGSPAWTRLCFGTTNAQAVHRESALREGIGTGCCDLLLKYQSNLVGGVAAGPRGGWPSHGDLGVWGGGCPKDQGHSPAAPACARPSLLSQLICVQLAIECSIGQTYCSLSSLAWTRGLGCWVLVLKGGGGVGQEGGWVGKVEELLGGVRGGDRLGKAPQTLHTTKFRQLSWVRVRAQVQLRVMPRFSISLALTLTREDQS